MKFQRTLVLLSLSGMFGLGFLVERMMELPTAIAAEATESDAQTDTPVTPDVQTSPSPGTDPAAGSSSEATAGSAISTLQAQLQDSLKSKQWESADRLTYELMLQIVGSKSVEQGRFDIGEWRSALSNTASCDSFKEIDKLWRDASEGQLGFSAQMQVYTELEADTAKYYDAIGWRPLRGDWIVAWQFNPETKRYEYEPDKSPNFDEPTKGHLPARLVWSVPADYRLDMVKTCGFVAPS
jgi:predicted 3-demethylubiquinone-9 3-methyltransferase (glyoxalase superfamily)